MKFISILVFLILFPPVQSYADTFGRTKVLACDEESDQFIIRFGTLYNFEPLKEEDLVSINNDLLQTWKKQKITSNNTCTLKSGIKVKLTGYGGQSFPYGAGGGDPNSYAILFLDDNPIYYKKAYYANHKFVIGAIYGTINSLYQCSAKDDYGCENVSYRLKPEGLPPNEKDEEQKDKEREELKNNLSSECRELKHTYYDRDSSKMWEKLAPTPSRIPLSVQRMDINNDETPDTIFRLGYDGRCGVGCGTHYFDGNILIAFTEDQKQSDQFVKDLATSEIKFDTPDFINKIRSYGGIFFSLGNNSAIRYVYNTPFQFKGETYIYSMSTNQEHVPRYVISQILPNNQPKEICKF